MLFFSKNHFKVTFCLFPISFEKILGYFSLCIFASSRNLYANKENQRLKSIIPCINMRFLPWNFSWSPKMGKESRIWQLSHALWRTACLRWRRGPSLWVCSSNSSIICSHGSCRAIQPAQLLPQSSHHPMRFPPKPRNSRGWSRVQLHVPAHHICFNYFFY